MATISTPTHGHAWLYAFNVAEVKITGLTTGATATINVGPYTEVREASTDGEITANIAPYLQALFDTSEEDFDTYVTTTLKVETSDGSSKTQSIGVVYGAHNIGDNETPLNREVHVWPGITHLYSWLCDYAGTLTRYDEDDAEIEDTSGSSSHLAGLVTRTFPDWLESGDKRAVYFQDTQRRGTSSYLRFKHRIVWHDGEDGGLFLRWLDRYGCNQYWRFDVGNDERKTATYGSELPRMYNGGSIRYLSGAYQGKSAGRSVSVVTPLVDFDRWEWLCQLMASPVVYALNGTEWVPVSIASASNTWARDKNEHLQDFEAVVVFPELVTQTI